MNTHLVTDPKPRQGLKFYIEINKKNGLLRSKRPLLTHDGTNWPAQQQGYLYSVLLCD